MRVVLESFDCKSDSATALRFPDPEVPSQQRLKSCSPVVTSEPMKSSSPAIF